MTRLTEHDAAWAEPAVPSDGPVSERTQLDPAMHQGPIVRFGEDDLFFGGATDKPKA